MKDSDFKDLIERVREATDIGQIIGRRIKLDHNHKAICPFHKDDTPSFSVNFSGQYFHCSRRECGAGGDVFDFLEAYEEKSFTEVLSELARQAEISFPDLTPENTEHIEEERTIEDILTETAVFYHQSLTPEAKAYLTKERGLREETIFRFQIGYARGGLRDHLIDECEFPLSLCLRAGVLKNVDGAIEDYFYNRIIFPNIKRMRVVYLSGKSLDGGKPTYLNLPGEMHYLYNENTLFDRAVVITEGVFDCLSVVQSGYSAVATLGASNFKPEYLPKFSRCETIYLFLGGDDAGHKGTLRIGQLIGERARIIRPPKGLDPNDFLKSYPKQDFDALVASAKDVIKYELSLIPTDTDKTELPRRLEPVLKKLARMEKVKAEAYLSYEIKPRFKLRKEDVDGYRELVNKGDRCKHSPVVISLEALILKTLIGLRDKVERAILPVKAITDALNEGKPEKSRVTYQRVGRRLKAIGFKKARSGNNSGILWEEEKIKQLMEAYGLETPSLGT